MPLEDKFLDSFEELMSRERPDFGDPVKTAYALGAVICAHDLAVQVRRLAEVIASIRMFCRKAEDEDMMYSGGRIEEAIDDIVRKSEE